MQKYYTIIKKGGFILTCPACGGISQAEYKKKGVEIATEICPHCKVKIKARYESEDDSWWDQQKIKAKEDATNQMHLTESEQQELNELAKKTDDASLDRFCELLKKGAVTPDGIPWSTHELREAFKRLWPNATEKQLDIMVTGRAPSEVKGWL